MKCQILFLVENKKNIIHLSSAENAQRVVKVKYWDTLTFTTLWAFSADEQLMIFFLFFPENRIWHFMQIVS